MRREKLPSYAESKDTTAGLLVVFASRWRVEPTGDVGNLTDNGELVVVVETWNVPPVPAVEIRLMSAWIGLLNSSA